MNDFIYALFSPGERVYAGGLRGVREIPIEQVHSGHEFICINPLVGPRHRDNVSAYRNILVESDSLPLDKQREMVKEIGLPYTTAVFSGNKSVHYILSLDRPCADEAEYKALVKHLYAFLGRQGFSVDKSCKNPTRLSRNPGFYRADKGARQALEACGGKVSREALEATLGPMPVQRELPAVRLNRFKPVPNAFTRLVLRGELPVGERHRMLVCAAFDLKECGLEPDEVEAMLNASPTATTDPERFGAEISSIVTYVYAQN